jgi:drug/metabolite transporter (DMT)-like permease
LCAAEVGSMIRLVLMSVMLGSIGQIMMKSGSDRVGNLPLTPTTIVPDIIRILRIPEFWMALLLFAISSLIWVKVLSKSELTHAYPLGSMSYVFVFLFSALLLHEALTLQKVLGALVIMVGIFIIHR